MNIFFPIIRKHNQRRTSKFYFFLKTPHQQMQKTSTNELLFFIFFFSSSYIITLVLEIKNYIPWPRSNGGMPRNPTYSSVWRSCIYLYIVQICTYQKIIHLIENNIYIPRLRRGSRLSKPYVKIIHIIHKRHKHFIVYTYDANDFCNLHQKTKHNVSLFEYIAVD